MAANPPLVEGPGGQLFPAPYAGEYIGLSRSHIDFDLRGVRTKGGRWSARGTAYLTNMRLVFVSGKGPDADSGLQAFELPLAYVTEEAFSQPIFGANNLHGKCALVDSANGADASASASGPSFVEFRLYFKDGGCGTFIPIFYRDLAYIRSVAGRAAAAAETDCPPPAAAAAQPFDTTVATAVVDPHDPSVVYLMSQQPIPAEQQLKEGPKWARGGGGGADGK